MVIDFPINKEVYGEYCPVCHMANQADAVLKNGRKIFVCRHCNARNDRLIIIDPKIRWWTDEENVYFHESAGILLVNPAGKILFFELTKFPYGFTVPAGHVDANETPQHAVIRETSEEVGARIVDPQLVVETIIHGDSCSRGCDDHKWSLFSKAITQEDIKHIKVDKNEGQKPRWLTISEVDALEMPYAMRFIFDVYKKDIKSVLQDVAAS